MTLWHSPGHTAACVWCVVSELRGLVLHRAIEHPGRNIESDMALPAAEFNAMLAALQRIGFCPFLPSEMVFDGPVHGVSYLDVAVSWGAQPPIGWEALAAWWGRTTERFQALLPEAPPQARYPEYRIGPRLKFED
jgi:hypothetical protein